MVVICGGHGSTKSGHGQVEQIVAAAQTQGSQVLAQYYRHEAANAYLALPQILSQRCSTICSDRVRAET